MEFVKALVRWATGKRLTDRLPKLSLITLSTPATDRIYLYTGQRVTSTLFEFLGIRKYVSDSRHEEIHFSLKSVFMVDVRFELTTNDPWSVDDVIC